MYVEGARTPAGGGSNALQSTLTQKTEYYADGRVRRLEDSRGNTAARFEYDPTGRISKRTLPEDAFRMPGGGTVDHNQGDEEYVYTYRADGLLDTITDPDGRVITHAWDTAGRCTGMSVAAAPGSTPRIDGTTQISWTLDGLGRPVATTDDNGPGAGSSTVERTYTSLGLVATERQSEDLGGATVTRDVSAGHLSDGRQSLLSYPGNGPRVRAIPDIHGNTDFVVENVSGTTLVNHVHQQSYLSYLTFANGIRYGYGYNAKKQVAEIRSFTGTDFNDLSASISAHRYVYDARQLVVRDLDLKTDRFARLGYDSLGRLDAHIDGYDINNPSAVPRSAASEPNARYWSYDDGGNQLSVEAGLVITRNSQGRLLLNKSFEATASFNDANQMQSRDVMERNIFSGAITRRTEDLRHDRRGNLRRDANNDYRYDFLGRLVEVVPTVSGSTAVRIYWDGFGRRVRQDDLRFTYWGDDIIQEEPDSGAWYKRWIYGQKPGELVAYETNLSGTDKRYFIHVARTGNVEFLSDESGAVVERYAIDPFGTPELRDGAGQPMPAASGTGNALLMHRHYYSDSIGLYFVGPRVYHPFLNRFLQRDPAGLMADALARRHPYVYGGNNPENFGDDGNLAWFLAVPLYIGVSALMALAETALEEVIVERSTPPGAPSQFSFGRAYARNFGVNLATNWIPGSGPVRAARAVLARRAATGTTMFLAPRVLGYARVTAAARIGLRVGAATGGVAAYAVRTGAATALEWGIEQAPIIGTGRGVGSILLGNIAGDLVGLSLRRIAARLPIGRHLDLAPPGTFRDPMHPGWFSHTHRGVIFRTRTAPNVLLVQVVQIEGQGAFRGLWAALRQAAARSRARRVWIGTTTVVEETGRLSRILRRMGAHRQRDGSYLLRLDLQ